jgi:hypothetical protein
VRVHDSLRWVSESVMTFSSTYFGMVVVWQRNIQDGLLIASISKSSGSCAN